VMAADLATTPQTGIRVQLAGDSHLANFGGFASPERDLVFDINDFDETLPGPWEWDVKRLVASLAIAGRERGFRTKERRTLVRSTIAQYREAMRSFASTTNLAVFYARLDATELLARARQEAGHRDVTRLEQRMAKATTRDSMRAFDRLTHVVDGERRIVSDPPLIVPVEELMPEGERQQLETQIRAALRGYRRSLPGDRRHLLEEYRLVQLARKVVGVGSVGTRVLIALLLGENGDDPLFLQFKEAEGSVLAPFAGRSAYTNQGRRVVEGQRLLQSTSDVFLGWDRAPDLLGAERDFYVRQLWDWKISADLKGMSPTAMAVYGRVCGWTLARGHARSGDHRVAIAAYLGQNDAFDRALAEFAEAYADQNERDHSALVEAVKAGRVMAEEGV